MMSDIYHLAKNEVKLACENVTDDYSVFYYDTDHKRFQCKRMASLFKAEYSDGSRTYSDIDRCRCKTVVGNSYYCYPKESIEINNKLFPITMPYFPKDRYIFLVDQYTYTTYDGFSFK